MKKILKRIKIQKGNKKRNRTVLQLFITSFLLVVAFISIYGAVSGWFSFAHRRFYGSPLAISTQIINAKNGQTIHISASYVMKRIGTSLYRMLAYNDSIPGPIIKVKQGSRIKIILRDDMDMPTTLHAHGIRMENKYDGTMLTQDNIMPGSTYQYTLRFPDAGLYWYHSHTQEYMQQNMGLYGNIWVEPKDPSILPHVNKEVPLMLSDIILDNGDLPSYNPLNHTLMGRYGSTILVNGEQNISFQAKSGEKIRFYITNAANARPFNISIENQKLTLIGADDGYYEKRQTVNSVILGPGERSIVDVRFTQPGTYKILHTTPQNTYTLGTITIAGGNTMPMEMDTPMPTPLPMPSSMTMQRTVMSDTQDVQSVRSDLSKLYMRLLAYIYLNQKPDKNLVLTMTTNGLMNNPTMGMNTTTMPTQMMTMTATPMIGIHTTPTMGMTMQMRPMTITPMPSIMPCAGGGGTAMSVMTGNCPMQQQGPIEWEDDMSSMNQMSDANNIKWIMRDTDSGLENQKINWQFKTGQKIKIHIYNDPHAMHAMQHPIHFHGNDFLVLSYNGKPNDNLVWKDTIMIGAGESADILLNVTNPGKWMAHCHISEHLEDGMMLNYTVTGSDRVRSDNISTP